MGVRQDIRIGDRVRFSGIADARRVLNEQPCCMRPHARKGIVRQWARLILLVLVAAVLIVAAVYVGVGGRL